MKKIVTYLLLIVLGAGFSVWGWTLIDDARSTLFWPIVNGTVTHSKVTSYVSSSEGKSTQMYSADVRYRYIINGTAYSSGRVSLGDSSTSNSGGKKEIVMRYALGQQVLVYYDPVSPDESLLEPGPAFITYIPFAFGLLCMISGVIAFFRKIKGGRNAPQS